MKILMIAALSALHLSAAVYYAKVEPVETYTIKAAASGSVVTSNRKMEGVIADGKVVVQLDDALNREELASSKRKLESLKSILSANRENLKNLQMIAEIRESQYNRIKSLKTKSQVEKDNELTNLIGSKNQVISLQATVANQEVQINDLLYKIDTLNDTIAKKRIAPKDLLIYKLYVNENDYVNMGTSLVDAYDVSKGKLTIFLSAEDAKNAQNKAVYLNGEATDLKISKLWNVADTQNISSYRCEIVIPAPKTFSKLVQVELKDK